MKPNLICAMLAVILFATGCASDPYKQFYRPNPGVPPAGTSAIRGYIPKSGATEIYASTDLNADIGALQRRGYFWIGSAAFNADSGQLQEGFLREQADSVGAQAVLLYSEHSHTLSGIRTVTVPQVSTTTTTGSATAYGTGGSVRAYGNATATTTSNQTVAVPYSQDRSNVTAHFFVRIKHDVGLLFTSVSDDQRRTIGSNQGILVVSVVDNSPALRAGVLVGDILWAIGDVPMFGQQEWEAATDRYRGQTVAFDLLRDGEHLSRQIEILPW